MISSLFSALGGIVFTFIGFLIMTIGMLLSVIARYWAPILIAATIYVICGCSAQPRVVDHYINVDRIVSVPCDISPPNKPDFAVGMIKKGDTLPYITDAYMIDRHQRIAYEGQLEAALTACKARPVKGTGAAPSKAIDKSTSAGE